MIEGDADPPRAASVKRCLAPSARSYSMRRAATGRAPRPTPFSRWNTRPPVWRPRRGAPDSP